MQCFLYWAERRSEVRLLNDWEKSSRRFKRGSVAQFAVNPFLTRLRNSILLTCHINSASANLYFPTTSVPSDREQCEAEPVAPSQIGKWLPELPLCLSAFRRSEIIETEMQKIHPKSLMWLCIQSKTCQFLQTNHLKTLWRVLSLSLHHFCFSANTLQPITFSQFICENKPISNQLTRQNSFSSVTKFDPSFRSHPSGSVVSFVLHKATEVVRFLSSSFAVAETRFTFQCFPPKRSQFPQLGVESARTSPDSSLANCYLLCLSCCQSARLPPPQYHSVLLFLQLGCLTCLQLFGLRAAPDVDLLAATQENEKGNSQYLKQLPR